MALIPGEDYLRLIVPEFPEMLLSRYRLLRRISFAAPAGRRSLAAYFQLGEKVLRRELEVLREQGLIHVEQRGVTLTQTGEELLNGLNPYLKLLLGLNTMEQELLKLLQVKQVTVVPGDLEKDEMVLWEMGRAGARILRECLKPDIVLAVSGGTSCAAVADMLPELSAPAGIIVVPARGGLGEEVDYQANNIAALVARKLKAGYRLLHLPDSLSEDTLKMLLHEQKIAEILDQINAASVLLHGIGTAGDMAKRRGAGAAEIRKLEAKGAVGEVFGFFFNGRGEIVDNIPSLGLYLEDMNNRVDNVIVVAGGSKKAEAIIAVVGNHPRDHLVLDEGAARKILELGGVNVQGFAHAAPAELH